MMRELLRLDYRAHENYVSAARTRPEIWRVAFGAVLVVAIFLFLSETLWSALLGTMNAEQQESFLQSVDAGDTPGAVLFVLLQLALLIPATAFVVIALHTRRPSTLFGPPGAAWRQFCAVLAVQALLILALAVLPPHSINGEPFQRNVSLVTWLLLLPLGLGALLLQCTAEEVVFRGYLQQQLAARWRSPLVWLLVPSALFGAGHYMPGIAGENALAIAVLAGVFGLLMADLTARAGTLGPAIAVHVANNMSAMLLLAPADDMSGLALYTMPFGLGDTELVRAWLPVDLGAMLVSWLAARLVLRR